MSTDTFITHLVGIKWVTHGALLGNSIKKRDWYPSLPATTNSQSNRGFSWTTWCHFQRQQTWFMLIWWLWFDQVDHAVTKIPHCWQSWSRIARTQHRRSAVRSSFTIVFAVGFWAARGNYHRTLGTCSVLTNTQTVFLNHNSTTSIIKERLPFWWRHRQSKP